MHHSDEILSKNHTWFKRSPQSPLYSLLNILLLKLIKFSTGSNRGDKQTCFFLLINRCLPTNVS